MIFVLISFFRCVQFIQSVAFLLNLPEIMDLNLKIILVSSWLYGIETIFELIKAINMFYKVLMVFYKIFSGWNMIQNEFFLIWNTSIQFSWGPRSLGLPSSRDLAFFVFFSSSQLHFFSCFFFFSILSFNIWLIIN
jgi:hypothetical protein